jgi:hypothetical protein
MPALVKALNKVDLPTLDRPTMPHFKLMKISSRNQYPHCTIEPNVGTVEVPNTPMSLWRDRQANPKNGWGKAVLTDADCTYQRSPAAAQHAFRRAYPA